MTEIINKNDVLALWQEYRPDEDMPGVELLAGKINAMLDAATFGRSGDMLTEDQRQRLYGCATEIAGFLIRQQVNPELKSETVGDWSRTWAHTSGGTESEVLRGIIARWLSGTGLLCAWV